MIPANSVCVIPLPCMCVHTHTHILFQMITGVARSCNSRPTNYISRQAGRVVCRYIYIKTNTIKVVALLELHLSVI